MLKMRFIEVDEPNTLDQVLSDAKLSKSKLESWRQSSSQYILKTDLLEKGMADYLIKEMIALGGKGTLYHQNGRQTKVLLMGNLDLYHQLIGRLVDQKVKGNGISDFLQKQMNDLSKSVSYELDCRCKKLDLSKRTHVMGILNATPDSFYDGGRYYSHDRAVQRIFEMEAEGADLVDIGGESTRPGSETVNIDEEMNRVIPIIEQIKGKITIPISIDTRKSEVAEAAIVSGAHMVNDVSGLRYDPKMVSVIEKYRVPVVIMHMKGLPKDMQVNPKYLDLIGEIYEQLEQCVQIALKNGISKEKIIIDPGIGFGKEWADNFVLLRRLREFKSLGYPMLIGVSRKSFIGRLLNLNEKERLMGTAAAVAVSSLKGVEMVRVHDVKEMVQVVRIVDQLR